MRAVGSGLEKLPWWVGWLHTGFSELDMSTLRLLVGGETFVKDPAV